MTELSRKPGHAQEDARSAAPSPGPMAVDIEEKVSYARLREYRHRLGARAGI